MIVLLAGGGDSGRRALLAAIVAAAALGGYWAASQVGAGARPVSTRELAMSRERWVGRGVRVDGTLMRFLPGEPREHFAIDQDGYRVGIEGVPADRLIPLLGRRVSASGRFGFSERGGAFLDAESVEPTAP